MSIRRSMVILLVAITMIGSRSIPKFAVMNARSMDLRPDLVEMVLAMATRRR